jgi:hypothetical protein
MKTTHTKIYELDKAKVKEAKAIERELLKATGSKNQPRRSR